MSYIYSKFDSKKVYADPIGTVSKYKVTCDNNENFDFKNNGYLMLYLTKDKFIIRSFYNLEIFCIKDYGNVYLEIPFESIIRISCCDKDFSQIFDLSDHSLSNIEKSKIFIDFKKEDSTVEQLIFSIKCYITFSKNSKECQELINLYNSIILSEKDNQRRLQSSPLSSNKVYLHCPTLDISGIFLFQTYKNCFVFKSQFNDIKNISIPLSDIMSFTHEQNFEGSGISLSQSSYLKLVYKDNSSQQITFFIKFYLTNLNNSYPQKYIDFLTKLVDMGLIDKNKTDGVL